MVTKIIYNKNGEPLFKEITPDEGKALFHAGLEAEEEPFFFVSMPLTCDETELIEMEFIPKEIEEIE